MQSYIKRYIARNLSRAFNERKVAIAIVVIMAYFWRILIDNSVWKYYPTNGATPAHLQQAR